MLEIELEHALMRGKNVAECPEPATCLAWIAFYEAVEERAGIKAPREADAKRRHRIVWSPDDRRRQRG